MSLYTIVEESLPEFNTVPLERVVIDGSRVTVEADSIEEVRFELMFFPVQGVKSTSVDCFYVKDGFSLAHRTLLEEQNSCWIDVLSIRSKSIDNDATFVDKSRHFVLPLGDQILEVAAWEFSFSLKSQAPENT